MPIALVDCNSFYASCERIFRPDLKDRPIVVLSNNDGCIVAMSKEAKKLNISRGTPLFKLQDMFKQNNVKIFSSNYTLYGDISKRVMSIIMESSDTVEVYSIDEAFANWNFRDPVEESFKVRKRILNWVGMPVSIGIAETKTLAKIANHIAKKQDGVYWITENIREQILRDTPIESIWGIGRQTSLFLRARKIFTAYDFVQLEDWWVKKNLKIVTLRTKWELSGIKSIDMETEVKENKGILSSKSFGMPITDLENLIEATKSYTHDAFHKMIKQGLSAKTITFYLTTNSFKKYEKQYKNSIKIDLPDYTDYLPDFIRTVKTGIKQLYRPGYNYKKTSVMLTDLRLKKDITPDLFTLKDPRKAKIQASVNKINHKYGKGTIHCNLNKKGKPKWQMKRELLSPEYTTSWKDIPKVK